MTDLFAGTGSPSWDMSRTRELVCARWGENELEALRPVLRAVTTRLIHARIHFQDYQRLVNEHLRQPLESGTLGTVCAQLARETTTAPELAPIQQALEALSTAPAYQALADVTNHIKHHGGLPVRVGWGDSEQTPFEVLLSAFSRKQQTQPPREIAAFMEETYETMSRVVVTTGLALNEWLRHSTHASA